MKLILNLLVLFLCMSCSTKNTRDNSSVSLQKNDFLNQPHLKFQQQYPNLKLDEPIFIDGKSYIVSSLAEKGQQILQILSSSTSNLIVEVIQFPTDSKIIDTKEYPNTYKPKCEADSTFIKYDTKSNRIALIKNDKIVFQGESLLIQNRINDDKNKKCLSRWGH